MKRLFSLLVFIIFISSHAICQPTNWEWAISTGGISYSESRDVVADGSGNVYATGYYTNDTIQFGNFVLLNSGSTDVFIVKFEPSGNVVNAFQIGSSSSEIGYGIALDGNGGLYVTGYFADSTLTIGTTSLVNFGQEDGFIAKFDTSGTFVWARNFGGLNKDRGLSIDVDVNGNSVVTGVFNSPSLNFGSLQVVNPAPSALDQYFIVRYDPNGNAIWANANGSPLIDFGSAAAIDNSGNSYIAGAVQPGTDLQLFVSKYDITGSLIWTRLATGNGSNRAYGMDVDASGNVIVTGEFKGTTCTIGGQTLTNSGASGLNPDLLLVKLNSAGIVVWAKSEGENLSSDAGRAVETDPSGNIYVTGEFSVATFNFGTSVLVNNGVSDIFIAGYDASGNVLWANSGGGPSQELAYGIAVDGQGGVTTAGSNKIGTLHFGNITISVPTGNSNAVIAKLSYLTGTGEEHSEHLKLKLFPNPTSGDIHIDCKEVISKIEVYDVAGKRISEFAPYSASYNFAIKQQGFHYLKVFGKNSVSQIKVQVIK